MSARAGGQAATAGGRTLLARTTTTLVLCLALVACSGDDDTTDPTTAVTTTPAGPPAPATEQPRTDAPSTVAPTTALTTSPTTQSTALVSVSTAPVASTDGTLAPTTNAPTSAPLSDEDQVLALVEGSYEARRNCLRSISDCDPTGLSNFLVDPQLAADVEQIRNWQASSYEAENVDSLTFEVIEIDLDFTIPYVLICQRDGGSLVERVPGQPDRLVDGGYVEKIREIHLRQTPSGWRIEGFHTREEAADQEGALCS